jgi:ABC-type Zn uptake system ZnuABC Zn-binding protein ZnuA
VNAWFQFATTATGPLDARRGAVRCAALLALGAVLAAPFLVPAAAAARVKVAASIPDLASIAQSVGGDAVEVVAVARAGADPHRVEVLPSYMVRVSRVQVYLKVGLGLDTWADAIIDGSRNSKLLVVDCSQGVAVLEKPAGPVDARQGDVHPAGNPHYWLDPLNGAVVARRVAEALARVDPAHGADYAANAEAFDRRTEDLLARGRSAVAAMPSRDILTYHRSWSYFAQAFGLTVVATIEPIPGIPPTGRHLQDLVEIVRAQRVPVVMIEPYFSQDAGKFLSRQTDVRVVEASPSCDGPVAGAYEAHLEQVLGMLTGQPLAPGAGPAKP